MSKEVPITFRCPQELADRIDRLAEKADIPRSRLINNILEEITRSLELSGKVGILQFILILRDMDHALTTWAKKVKSKKVEPLQ